MEAAAWTENGEERFVFSLFSLHPWQLHLYHFIKARYYNYLLLWIRLKDLSRSPFKCHIPIVLMVDGSTCFVRLRQDQKGKENDGVLFL